MTISIEILEQLFDSFVALIQNADKQPFTHFSSSQFIDNQENYKYSVYHEAIKNLGSKLWKEGDIGTGKIKKNVSSAIQTKAIHNHRNVDNNLLYWREKDNFSKSSNNKALERILFDFYKYKVDDSLSFQLLAEQKLTYQFIAYLFFVKDSQKYLPISQRKFDEIFEEIGIKDFKTSNNISWENYNTFLSIIKNVQSYLKTKDSNCTLLDAHSFLWILGNQMKTAQGINTQETSEPTSLPSQVIQSKENIESVILEEDDELSFPEGKEIYRLHKSKERNTELIKTVKLNRLQKDKDLSCEVCNFSFSKQYGELGEGFIEAHHLFPISQLTEETETKISDIALVCSNCHRMLHRKRPWITVEELKNIYNSKL
ncbi:HNH endonuclease [Flectobacillus longus]|uniref:HNH endonuclease n=1 Tax=Flectobacillus longus TaxID=2984207 RepID=UPI0024B705A7|nr:HNH endonuclease [Flectobacillus longus]MDI9882741.1 HNH endonuclease [Flectobacillus longus]